MGRACVIGAVLCLCFTACGGKGAETPEELGREVLGALRAGDLDAILEHLVTPEDADWIHAKLVAGGGEKIPEREQIRGGASDQAREATREDWQRILDRAEKDGVDWAKAEFERVEVEGSEELKGVEAGRVHLVFRCEGKRYQIRLAEVCVKTDHGWVLFPDARWYGAID